ncbi:glycosyltransferase family 2 protein [Crenobacter intestini]|uniref:Glycosyltransferase family 2 protein n=1 Tax=Crenobacter intestini TaxID=2563443 RepID=A0A4T0UIY9_9NEIS|nr:glycosyltransferase family 2 protein [Crenobacter intestini]TIC78500.1 glycosyltransferase family 2 protein [Crenobacter intestini]
MHKELTGRVAILMGAYNGERYLEEQLQSFLGQNYENWSLHVSDDGSSDRTRQLLSNFEHANARPVQVIDGPRKGFCQNFLSLLCNPDIDADYFCFSDQDDVWHADKLSRALGWLRAQPADVPALYCGRTHLVDDDGTSLGYSPLFTRAPSFSNALVQSIGGGNTMMMNRAAREVCQRAGAVDVVSHDWWVYIATTAVGGRVHYDAQPSLDYRQHGNNIVGSNMSWQARLERVKMLGRGRFKQWGAQHLRALQVLVPLMPSHNWAVLAAFERVHRGNLASRIIAFRKGKLYRQTALGNAGLLVATLFNKI